MMIGLAVPVGANVPVGITVPVTEAVGVCFVGVEVEVEVWVGVIVGGTISMILRVVVPTTGRPTDFVVPERLKSTWASALTPASN